MNLDFLLSMALAVLRSALLSCQRKHVQVNSVLPSDEGRTKQHSQFSI
jgi:hypothetical protein